MKRNVKGTFDNTELSMTKKEGNEILSVMKEIRDDIKRCSFHVKMDCTDISEFFPLENDATLIRYNIFPFWI